VLRHANQYGLKYIFVHDPYYEPLLAFAGWRKFDTWDRGRITAWSKESVPPARKIDSDAVPQRWAGILWGTLPFGSSIVAIALVLLLPDRKRLRESLEFPAVAAQANYAREAK
jgi:hypothetical protein